VWVWISGVNNHTQEIENREKELEIIQEGQSPYPQPAESSLVQKTLGVSGGQLVLVGLLAVLGHAWIKRGAR
jgi:hypothetical protein